jgi:signal transduction histidine kinase
MPVGMMHATRMATAPLLPVLLTRESERELVLQAKKGSLLLLSSWSNAASGKFSVLPRTTHHVNGDAIDIHPIVRDEIYRIGYEAMHNACVHSGASQLEVELRYAQDLTLRVSDNGRGIDPVIAHTGKDGHFGLQGMRERASRISGKFTLVTSSNSGTEITLVVPRDIIA